MSVRRRLQFWSRLVRYQVSQTGLFRKLGSDSVKRRVAKGTLLAIILVGGYLIGRVSAPGCAPLASAVCTEPQAQSAPQPTPAPSERQTVVVLASLPSLPPTSAFPSASAIPLPAVAEMIPALPEKKPAAVVLSNDEVREMQAWLKAFGFDPGPIDGYPGNRTTAAVKRYQAAHGTEETGQLDRTLLRQVRRQAGHS
jgi:hypothetical protein